MRESWAHVTDGILRLAMQVGEFRSMRLAIQAMRYLKRPMAFVASPYHPDLADDNGHAFSEQARCLGHYYRSDARTNPGLIYLRRVAEQPMKSHRRPQSEVLVGIPPQVAERGSCLW